jgi:hypothetical protein
MAQVRGYERTEIAKQLRKHCALDRLFDLPRRNGHGRTPEARKTYQGNATSRRQRAPICGKGGSTSPKAMPETIAEGAIIRRQSRKDFCQRVGDNAFHLTKHRIVKSPRRQFDLFSRAAL